MAPKQRPAVGTQPPKPAAGRKSNPPGGHAERRGPRGQRREEGSSAPLVLATALAPTPWECTGENSLAAFQQALENDMAATAERCAAHLAYPVAGEAAQPAGSPAPTAQPSAPHNFAAMLACLSQLSAIARRPAAQLSRDAVAVGIATDFARHIAAFCLFPPQHGAGCLREASAPVMATPTPAGVPCAHAGTSSSCGSKVSRSVSHSDALQAPGWRMKGAVAAHAGELLTTPNTTPYTREERESADYVVSLAVDVAARMSTLDRGATGVAAAVEPEATGDGFWSRVPGAEAPACVHVDTEALAPCATESELLRLRVSVLFMLSAILTRYPKMANAATYLPQLFPQVDVRSVGPAAAPAHTRLSLGPVREKHPLFTPLLFDPSFSVRCAATSALRLLLAVFHSQLQLAEEEPTLLARSGFHGTQQKSSASAPGAPSWRRSTHSFYSLSMQAGRVITALHEVLFWGLEHADGACAPPSKPAGWAVRGLLYSVLAALVSVAPYARCAYSAQLVTRNLLQLRSVSECLAVVAAAKEGSLPWYYTSTLPLCAALLKSETLAHLLSAQCPPRQGPVTLAGSDRTAFEAGDGGNRRSGIEGGKQPPAPSRRQAASSGAGGPASLMETLVGGVVACLPRVEAWQGLSHAAKNYPQIIDLFFEPLLAASRELLRPVADAGESSKPTDTVPPQALKRLRAVLPSLAVYTEAVECCLQMWLAYMGLILQPFDAPEVKASEAAGVASQSAAVHASLDQRCQIFESVLLPGISYFEPRDAWHPDDALERGENDVTEPLGGPTRPGERTTPGTGSRRRAAKVRRIALKCLAQVGNETLGRFSQMYPVSSSPTDALHAALTPLAPPYGAGGLVTFNPLVNAAVQTVCNSALEEEDEELRAEAFTTAAVWLWKYPYFYRVTTDVPPSGTPKPSGKSGRRAGKNQVHAEDPSAAAATASVPLESVAPYLWCNEIVDQAANSLFSDHEALVQAKALLVLANSCTLLAQSDSPSTVENAPHIELGDGHPFRSVELMRTLCEAADFTLQHAQHLLSCSGDAQPPLGMLNRATHGRSSTASTTASVSNHSATVSGAQLAMGVSMASQGIRMMGHLLRGLSRQQLAMTLSKHGERVATLFLTALLKHVVPSHLLPPSSEAVQIPSDIGDTLIMPSQIDEPAQASNVSPSSTTEARMPTDCVSDRMSANSSEAQHRTLPAHRGNSYFYYSYRGTGSSREATKLRLNAAHALGLSLSNASLFEVDQSLAVECVFALLRLAESDTSMKVKKVAVSSLAKVCPGAITAVGGDGSASASSSPSAAAVDAGSDHGTPGMRPCGDLNPLLLDTMCNVLQSVADCIRTAQVPGPLTADPARAAQLPCVQVGGPVRGAVPSSSGRWSGSVPRGAGAATAKEKQDLCDAAMDAIQTLLRTRPPTVAWQKALADRRYLLDTTGILSAPQGSW